MSSDEQLQSDLEILKTLAPEINLGSVSRPLPASPRTPL